MERWRRTSGCRVDRGRWDLDSGGSTRRRNRSCHERVDDAERRCSRPRAGVRERHTSRSRRSGCSRGCTPHWSQRRSSAAAPEGCLGPVASSSRGPRSPCGPPRSATKGTCARSMPGSSARALTSAWRACPSSKVPPARSCSRTRIRSRPTPRCRTSRTSTPRRRCWAGSRARVPSRVPGRCSSVRRPASGVRSASPCTTSRCFLVSRRARHH